MLVHMPSLVFCLPWLRDRNPRAGAEGTIKRWLAVEWHWQLANQLPFPSQGAVSHPPRAMPVTFPKPSFSLTNFFPGFSPSLPALAFDSNSRRYLKPTTDFKNVSRGFKFWSQRGFKQRLLGLQWQHDLCFGRNTAHPLSAVSETAAMDSTTPSLPSTSHLHSGGGDASSGERTTGMDREG